MSEFLFEIFSEEIPASPQKKAAQELKTIFETQAQRLGIEYSQVTTYHSPRRLVLHVQAALQKLTSGTTEKRGPRIDAPDAAIDGFLRANKLTKEELFVKEQFYYANINNVSETIEQSLVKIVDYIFANLAWPKTMRWDESNVSWIRPIRNILCIYDKEVLPATLGVLKANNLSFGHRFMAASSFAVKDFAQYKQELSLRKVILDQDERYEQIVAQANKLAQGLDLTINHDDSLFEEISSIVEYPVGLVGKIDKKFLELPDEVLINTMKTHQRYLSLLNKSGRFAPYFLVFANIKMENMETIICGNEKVLQARLEDAKFFYDQDRKYRLEDRLDKLKEIIFHAKLGTVYDKTMRIKRLSAEMADKLGLDKDVIVRIATLAKCDLPTNLVIEFPELQGVIGKYYALNDNEQAEVALGVQEHYLPAGRNDACPVQIESAIVSIADKMDSIVGMFTADEAPTSSKDPYGLRRSALGIIRIILEHDLAIDLNTLIASSFASYNKSCEPNKIISFFTERFRFYLKDIFRYDFIAAILDEPSELEILAQYNKIRDLSEFASFEEGKNALVALKRVYNFIVPHDELIADTDMCKEEKALHMAAKQIPVSPDLKDLADLTAPINDFCDNVTVMDADPQIRNRRLTLLASIYNKFAHIANFSLIEL